MKTKTKKNEGEDQRNEGGRKIIVVITTNLRVFASSHMLRGRWRQLVVTCLVFTSSIKSRGHSPAHNMFKGIRTRTSAMAFETLY